MSIGLYTLRGENILSAGFEALNPVKQLLYSVESILFMESKHFIQHQKKKKKLIKLTYIKELRVIFTDDWEKVSVVYQNGRSLR